MVRSFALIALPLAVQVALVAGDRDDAEAQAVLAPSAQEAPGQEAGSEAGRAAPAAQGGHAAAALGVAGSRLDVVEPEFTFGVSGTPCANPNFGPLGGIAALVSTVEAIRTASRKEANTKNCRLCDIHASDVSMQSVKAEVKCSTIEDPKKCLDGNGQVGKWKIPHTEAACMPCPDACDSCEQLGKLGAAKWLSLKHYSADTYFRCELKKQQTVDTEVWTCDEEKAGVLLCKYRENLLNEEKHAKDLDVGGLSTWNVRVIAVPCKTSKMESTGLVSQIIDEVSPALLECYNKEYSEVCQITAKGTFSSQNTNPDLKEAKGTCLHDTLGTAACRSDLGPVGWTKSKTRTCQPCPFECMSCEVAGRSERFVCVFPPSATPAEDRLKRLFSANPGDEQKPLPKGYSCDPPVTRKCEEGALASVKGLFAKANFCVTATCNYRTPA